MAKNYMAYEAAEIIAQGLNKDNALEYQDIFKRFPYFASLVMKLNEAGLELLRMLPEYMTARKINKNYKEFLGVVDANDEVVEEEEPAAEEKEEAEAEEEKLKKRGRKAKKVEEPAEAEDDDIDVEEEEEEKPKKAKKKIEKKAKKSKKVEVEEEDDDDFDFDDEE